jgi:DNA-binding transcriptional LysR family regulator
MKYTLHQLEIFSKVTDLKSITKAANELYLTQPAVSIQLKKFQGQFSSPLFEVVSRKLYITDFGKEVALSAEKILDEVAELNLRTHAFNGQLAGKLKVALVSTAKYVMPYFLKDFIDEHQKVNLNIDVTNKASVINSIQTNKVDFGLVSVIPSGMNINRIELMSNKLYLVGGRQAKFEDKNITKKQFASLPMLYREKGSATRAAMENYIAENGVSNTKRLELTSNEAIKHAIIAGLGYSIMPIIGIKNELDTGDIKIVSAKGLPIVTNWNLIWLKSKKLSPTSTAFVNYLEKYKSEIINKSFGWYERY